MRIITGSARGRKLITLEGSDVRPTSEMVKESLFNILQFGIEGRSFLDMFAGSGQIGLEALSRGAESAVFVDSSKRSVGVIETNMENSGLAGGKVVCADSVMYVKRTPEKFDVAFLDPPYSTGVLEKALEAVTGAMNEGGVIICEHPSEEKLPEEVNEFRKVKDYRYGRIMLTSYRRV